MKNILITSALALFSLANAQVQTGPQIYYIAKKDPMTDSNMGMIIMREVNDVTMGTFFVLRCDGAGGYDLFFKSKNLLLTQPDYDSMLFPQMMYRVDSKSPKTISTVGAVKNEQPQLDSLTFMDSQESAIHAAFIEGNKVAVRILRHGMSNLDYTFPAIGYTVAFNKINRCK